MRFRDQSIIITGATRGIGPGIAKLLASEGASLTLGYLNRDDDALGLQNQLGSAGTEPVLYRGDLSTHDACKEIVRAAVDRFGKVDALVSNLGPFLWRSIPDMSIEDWDRMISANLSQHFYLVHELLPVMHEHGGGNFIFIGGIGSGMITGHPAASAYNSAKVGLAEFSRTLAIEEGPNNIRSNMIAPGIIDNGEYSDGYKKRIVDEIPLRYVGEPEDIAHTVAWLLSDESRYVTGSVIDVSGGYHLTMK